MYIYTYICILAICTGRIDPLATCMTIAIVTTIWPYVLATCMTIPLAVAIAIWPDLPATTIHYQTADYNYMYIYIYTYTYWSYLLDEECIAKATRDGWLILE